MLWGQVFLLFIIYLTPSVLLKNLTPLIPLSCPQERGRIFERGIKGESMLSALSG